MKKLRSPIQWFGGKSLLKNKLLPLVPEHKIYVEPFGGGASMLIAKEPSKVEVYNDLNSGLVNFFRILRDRSAFPEFQRLVSLTPYSREEWLHFRDTWEACEDLIERAYQWFVVARMSFSGEFAKSWAYSKTASTRGMAQCVSGWLSAIELLPQICERLLRVIIENKNAFDLIETFDGRDTFFYLDPPYMLQTRRGGGYKHELSDDEHGKLIEILIGLKGKVMLSGYASPLYEELEKIGFERRDFDVHCLASCHTVNSKGGSNLRVESIWTNYDLAD